MTFMPLCFLIVRLVICASTAHHETLDRPSSPPIQEAIIYVRAPRANGNVDPSTLEVITSSFSSSDLPATADPTTVNKTGMEVQDDDLIHGLIAVKPESDSLTLELSNGPSLSTSLELEHDEGTERSRRKVLKHVLEEMADVDRFHKENNEQTVAANSADGIGGFEDEKFALRNKNEQLTAPTKYDLFSKTDGDESVFEFSGTTDENIFESDMDMEDLPFATSAPINFDILKVSANAIRTDASSNNVMATIAVDYTSTDTTTYRSFIEVTETMNNIKTNMQSEPSSVALDDVDIAEDEATDILDLTNAATTVLSYNRENISDENEKIFEKNAEASTAPSSLTSNIVTEFIGNKDISLESTTRSSINTASVIEPMKSKDEASIDSTTAGNGKNYESAEIATNNDTKTKVEVLVSALDQISLEEDEKIIGEDTKALSNLTEDIVTKVDSLYEQASSTKLTDEEEKEMRKMFGEQYDDYEVSYLEKILLGEAVSNVKAEKKSKGVGNVHKNKKNDCLKNSDREIYIVRMILGNRANFTVQIIIEDTSFFIPEDVKVYEDPINMLLNFSWRSTNRITNNSLSLMLTQISNDYLVTGVKLNVMKCDEMSDWIKNEVLLPKISDTYGQLELVVDMDDEVTIIISNINFLKINHDEAEQLGPTTIDIDDALLQMEITVAVSTFCSVIVIGILSTMIYFVIVRRKRRIFDFKNKKICPL